jgi:hypothetical protein
MPSASPKVSVIIPNYNGLQHLTNLLPSIADQTFHDYEVIIIDDCSPDRSAVDYIETYTRDRANFHLITNTENLGFVRNCNKGFGLAQGDYLCILTNDTSVTRDFIQKNIAAMEADGAIGVLSCCIIDQDGNNWFTGGLLRNGVWTNLKDDFLGIRVVDWVAGTACFYRTQLVNEVGLLDETLVMYYEDLDFCLRVRGQTSYKICVLSDKLVTHHIEHRELLRPKLASLTRVQYHTHKNNVILAKRHYPQHLAKMLVQNLGDTVRWPFLALSQRRPQSFLASGYVAMIIAVATLAGLVKDARLKVVHRR